MPSPAPERAAPLAPLELLFEGAEPPGLPLPEELEAQCGGPFALAAGTAYANFVSSADGVAVVGPNSGSALSGHSQADRLVMGLLRSGADAVVIGAGTLAASPGHVWSAEHIYPPLAAAFAELRRRLRLAEQPTLVVVSGSGRLDLTHPGLARPALILTSDEGRSRLAGVHHQVRSLGAGPELDPERLLGAVRETGHRTVLSEGGPRLLGQLLRARLLDQLFLTLAPRLAGRTEDLPRAGIVAGVDLLGQGGGELRLLGARRSESHLFLRYLIER